MVELYLRGDEQAQKEVDTWLHRAAAPFRGGLGEDWFDVLQDVRLEVMRLLREGRFRGESSLKTYLWRVAAHTCLDALRRRRRRPIANEEPSEEQCPPDRGPSPLDAVLDDERQARLLTLLANTSEECRAIWRLVLAGASYSEAARQLGVSEGALRVRAHRCRKRIAEELARNAEGTRDAHD